MKHLITRLRALCVSSFPLVASVLVIVNLAVSCSVSRAVKPVYRYHAYAVTNYVATVVTNYVPLYDAPASVVTNSNGEITKPVPPRYDGRYKYFVLESRRMAYMNGTYYREGDICSRGLIIRIFPDRIFLHDGSTIENGYEAPLDTRPERSPLVTEFPKSKMRY